MDIPTATATAQSIPSGTVLPKPHHHGSPYGYTPTKWICILYVALFSATTLLHVAQTFVVRPRLYWIIPTIVFCGLCETLGWSARLWSSTSPSNIDAFLMQITTTILAPTFLTAAFYTILGRIISLLGGHYSRLAPKAYLITFLTADVVALVVQAVGGAKASLAFQNGHDPNPGAHIMLAGIFLQMAGIILYLLLAGEFLLRVYLHKPLRTPALSASSSSEKPSRIPPRTLALIPALIFATILVLIRSIYRSIELIGGWRGRVITTERYFNILDAAPVVLALITLNIIHPAFCLRDADARGGYGSVPLRA